MVQTVDKSLGKRKDSPPATFSVTWGNKSPGLNFFTSPRYKISHWIVNIFLGLSSRDFPRIIIERSYLNCGEGS